MMKKIFYLILFFIVAVGGLCLSKPKVIEIESKDNNEKIFQKDPGGAQQKFLPFPLEEFKNNLISEKSDFIEIDLAKMTAYLYKAGKIIKEIPVLARGNPATWGGNPVGLYLLKAKNKLAFSIAEEVYMPDSINFYGKYEIHGPPYYPDGTLLQSSFTAGCIRFSEKNIKSLYNFAQIGMPILITDSGFKNDGYQYPQPESVSKFPEISAKSYLVADLSNGFIFLEKNSQEALPIASLTKLMLAVVVLENVDLRKSVLVTQKMIEPFKSFGWFQQKLEVGKNYRVVELFYPALISSSNDAAEALSYFLGKERTITLMNEKAKSIGMKNTKFFEPTGLGKLINAEENLSPARDLFYLAQYILNVRPLLFKITKGEKVQTFGPISFKNLNNKNIFFNEPNFIGGKTGYTKIADNTAIFLFNLSTKENLNRKIAIILLGSKNLKKDTEDILQWLKVNYFK